MSSGGGSKFFELVAESISGEALESRVIGTLESSGVLGCS